MSGINQVFKPGLEVLTINPERDIELIPAGTKIVLVRRNGETLWYGQGSIRGAKRDLLVFASNLRRI